MKNSAIIVSGGMDSITLLYDHKDEIALGISFDYGSNHNAREIPFAKMHCERLGIKHITINLDFMHQYFKSSLLDGAEAIPEGHYADDNMKSTVVPFRNGIMLAIAIGIAESNNLDQIFIANHGGDHTIYPDCRPEFINAIDAAATAGTYNNVKDNKERYCTHWQATWYRLRRDMELLQRRRSALWQMWHLCRTQGSSRRSRNRGQNNI